MQPSEGDHRLVERGWLGTNGRNEDGSPIHYRPYEWPKGDKAVQAMEQVSRTDILQMVRATMPDDFMWDLLLNGLSEHDWADLLEAAVDNKTRPKHPLEGVDPFDRSDATGGHE